ncbi:MAG: UDP-N-acetylmuramoyl-L-alanine--D-glutamate ligase [Candidatus Brocadiaceae bacterium]|nr:UDP-N-acetylmuramoyl-L-alanine--D-glutamate ligase [Candidatus Brocadiaceae bacterium]
MEIVDKQTSGRGALLYAPTHPQDSATVFKGKKITVMGLGLFGGGAGLTRFLVTHGARVTVTDLKKTSQLAPSLESLKGLSLELHLGGHREEDFKDVDMVVVNPAIPRDSRFLHMARENGVPLETEMNLFFKFCPASIVGITGSKGKSTTTALIAAMLQRSEKRVWLGGNIGMGYSLLERIEEMGTGDLVVLELSSFQLEDLDHIRKSPHVAVVTNLAPNHLDRHKDMDSYIEAKKAIFRHQTAGDYVILNWDDLGLRDWAQETTSRVLWYSLKYRPNFCQTVLPPFHSQAVPPRYGAFLLGGTTVQKGQEAILKLASVEEKIRLSGRSLPGRHNLENILAASCASLLLGVSGRDIEETIQSFTGLEHRLEFVAELKGVKYYNDSIATTPESAIAGLKTFEAPIVLIAGGYDKKIPLESFAQECVERSKCVILIGETAPTLMGLITRLKPVVSEANPKGTLPNVFQVPSLAEAVRLAGEVASPGDIVLLSPACASYDMYENFQERGKEFKTLVGANTRG